MLLKQYLVAVMQTITKVKIYAMLIYGKRQILKPCLWKDLNNNNNNNNNNNVTKHWIMGMKLDARI